MLGANGLYFKIQVIKLKWEVLVLRIPFSFLNMLKTMNTIYFSFVSKASGCNLSRSCTSGSPRRLQLWCRLVLRSHLKMWLGEELFPSSWEWILTGFSSSQAVGWRSTLIPYHEGLFIAQMKTWQAAQSPLSEWAKEQTRSLKTEVTFFL